MAPVFTRMNVKPGMYWSVLGIQTPLQIQFSWKEVTEVDFNPIPRLECENQPGVRPLYGDLWNPMLTSVFGVREVHDQQRP